MKLFNKQTLILLISVVSINILCIISVSYAYFSLKILGTENAKPMSFDAGTMRITYTDFDEVTLEGAVPGDSVSKHFTVENTGDLRTKYNIKIDVETNNFKDKTDLVYTLTKNEQEKISNQILPYVDGYILKDEEIEAPTVPGTQVIDDYILTVTFKNDLDNPDQNDNAENRTVKFKVVVDTEPNVTLYEYVEPPQTKEFSEIIVADNDTIFADGTEQNNIRYAGSNDKVHNYIWFNCDNYDFNVPTNEEDTYAKQAAAKNCEKWRIIGLMNNVETESKGEQSLVKIIRDEALPRTAEDTTKTFSWDGTNYTEENTNLQSYNNDWSTSELMYLLNGNHDNHKAKTSSSGTEESANNSLYWNSGQGKCYTGSTTLTECDFSTTGLKNDTTRNMIEKVKWNLGGLSGTSSADSYYSTATASKWYQYERLTEVYNGDRKTEWTGKIGLMYPSDYGYATGGGGTYDRQACLAYQLYNWNGTGYKEDCAGNDWLWNSSASQWTLTPLSSYSDYVFFVYSDGHVSSYRANDGNAVRPSLYLKSDVQILNGNGTSEEPYVPYVA